MTLVSVMRNRYVPSFPRHATGERIYALDVGDAMTRTYSTDAHFVQYASPVGRRLAREAIGDDCTIRLHIIAFDIDCAETHGTGKPAPEPWRQELRRQLRAVADVHPAGFFYETKGGMRALWALDTPFQLRTQDDARAWSQQYAVAIAYLERRFGIVCDPACGDWQRLFRAPHATRDLGASPEAWPTYGDAHNIGALSIDASAEDVELASRRSKAFVSRRTLDFQPCSADGYGLLYHLLRARGDLVREHRANSFVIRCPRESEHSCGRTGDGSTILYLPAGGEQIGAIHCLHGHCARLNVRDWLRVFSHAELDAARIAAGITRAA